MNQDEMYGKDQGKQMNEKEEFQERFIKMWQAYVNEPGTALMEKQRRQREMDKELEAMAKHNLDEDINSGTEGQNNFQKSPFDNPEPEQDLPMEEKLLHEGKERTKVNINPNIKGNDETGTGIVSTNDIRFIKKNVHISKHLIKKMSAQKAHFREVIGRHGEPQINEQNMPNLEQLPSTQRKWFEEYKESAAKLKKSMSDPKYSVLKAIGLNDDIPTAICLVASMKPGVHEASQKILTDEFGVQDTNGTIPLHEMSAEKHDEVKLAYEIVEKVIVDSIERCTRVMEMLVKENGFMEVAKLIDYLIPMYVPYKRVAKYLEFNKELMFNKEFKLTKSQEKIKRAQEVFNMHLGVKFTASFEILDEIVREIKAPEDVEVDL